MRISVNLDTMYGGLPPLRRFKAAADDGFACVEFWAPPDDLTGRSSVALAELGLKVASVNTAAGDAPGAFGQLSHPDAVRRWREGFARTLEFARGVNAGAINVLVGGRQTGHTRSQQMGAVVENLQWALGRLDDDDPLLLIEPLNSAERPSPVVRNVEDALAVMRLLDNPAQVRLLFDVYHLAQEEVSVTEALRRALHVVGHVQLADYPGRHEPGTGQLPIGAVLDELERADYRGWIGLEYFPSGLSDPFAWLTQLRPAQSLIATSR